MVRVRHDSEDDIGTAPVFKTKAGSVCVPHQIAFLHRGEDLKRLTYHEYAGMIRIIPKNSKDLHLDQSTDATTQDSATGVAASGAVVSCWGCGCASIGHGGGGGCAWGQQLWLRLRR